MVMFIFYMIFMIPLFFFVGLFGLINFFFILFLIILVKLNFLSYFSMLSYLFGMDFLSFCLILLSVWICSLMLLASESLNKENYYIEFFMFILFLMLFSLFMTFSSINLFVFYLFFEISLVPTLIFILGWGYQPERIQAGVYMFFYTLFASLPMMVSIFYFYYYFNSLNFFFFNSLIDSYIIYFCTILVFLVKIPMFFFHLWLPKAHVEAPVSGSMILAGLMLKLGGYGLLRLMGVFLKIGLKINLFFIVISLFGSFIISLVCLRQSDMKSLIAYSSISHMGLVLSGIMTMNLWGYYGSLIMMVGHGLCSSGMFCLANIVYERLHTRSLFLTKGLINFMPSFSLWWFLLCSSNIAAPPSLNLLGEIMLFNSVISWSVVSLMFLIFISFFGAAYSLYLYSCSQHGKVSFGLYSFSLGYVREYLLLFLHWLPLNLLVLVSDMIFI
uniref:NADH-ubiquinone oxidoreductase chain 4 n=1 Tax=Omalisus fontisbellaquei TaxID=350094 RepID=A0A0S2MNK6_9COLE|nr:NADH deshydrogenase subunit 4 [Omalisus fontisbellaquei]